VLVHGAFTDASSWAGVSRLLHAAGLTVHAVANPLRGLDQDAAYVRSLLRQIDEPVVLVGHGYGGAVITGAAADGDSAVALCYVAAFGLDTGECVLDITRRFNPMQVSEAIAANAVDSPAGPQSELYIRKEHFSQVYAADLPLSVTNVMAVAQRPIAQIALSGESGAPAWACKPSWFAIAAADRVLDPTAQRFMAQRMAATEYMLDASHAVLLSKPRAVAAMILEAVEHGNDGGDYDLRHTF
jgi:pimeloyl-ACP methyl ester carboxylesterase